MSPDETASVRPNMVRSAESAIFESFLSGKPEGTVVTYGELGEAIGVTGFQNHPKYRGILNAVIVKLTNRGDVWANVRNVGYKLLNDAEKADILDAHTKGARRKLLKAVKIVGAIRNIEGLDEKRRAKVLAVASMAGAARSLLGKSTTTKVLSAVEKAQRPLSVPQVLAAMDQAK